MAEFKNKALGKTKRVIGKYTGNRSLQAKGAVQEFAGRAEGAARNIGRDVKRGVSKVRRNARGGARRMRSAAARRRA